MAASAKTPGAFSADSPVRRPKLDAFLPDRTPIRSGNNGGYMHAAMRRKAEGRTILRVACDGLVEQCQNLPDLPLAGAKKHRVGTQIRVVCG